MKKLLIFIFLLMPTLTFANEDKFIYDDNNLRDPFWSLISAGGTFITYDEDLSISDVALEGIIGDASGNNMAIINGQILQQGHKIGPFVIENIQTDKVILIKGNDQFILRINKGE